MSTKHTRLMRWASDVMYVFPKIIYFALKVINVLSTNHPVWQEVPAADNSGTK